MVFMVVICVSECVWLNFFNGVGNLFSLVFYRVFFLWLKKLIRVIFIFWWFWFFRTLGRLWSDRFDF